MPETAIDGKPQYGIRFRHAVERIIGDVHELRRTYAALSASGGRHPSNLYVRKAASALQSDLLIRLMRIFGGNGIDSIWYLHRIEAMKVAEGINLTALEDFSSRLKRIRRKVFVHIDRDAVFEPQKVYQEAEINWSEVRGAIELAWEVLNKLYVEQHGEAYLPRLQTSLDSLIQDFKYAFAAVAK